MRTSLILCIIIAVSLLLCPAAAFSGRSVDNEETRKVIAVQTDDDSGGDYISVMSSSTGKTEKIKLREYIIGSVAAEMPANYHTEALKAQVLQAIPMQRKSANKTKNTKNLILEKLI